jgi:hypothetical protein
LVVACSEQQVLKLDRRERVPVNQLMRIQIESHADLKAAPRSLYRGERRIDIIEIMDGTDPAIATSKSEDMTIACTSSGSMKSATNGS